MVDVWYDNSRRVLKIFICHDFLCVDGSIDTEQVSVWYGTCLQIVNEADCHFSLDDWNGLGQGSLLLRLVGGTITTRLVFHRHGFG